MRALTWEDLQKVNDKLNEQKVPTKTLVFSPETIELLKKEKRLITDKDGRMWINNWYPTVNGIEVFTSEYLEPEYSALHQQRTQK